MTVTTNNLTVSVGVKFYPLSPLASYGRSYIIQNIFLKITALRKRIAWIFYTVSTVFDLFLFSALPYFTDFAVMEKSWAFSQATIAVNIFHFPLPLLGNLSFFFNVVLLSGVENSTVRTNYSTIRNYVFHLVSPLAFTLRADIMHACRGLHI
jgi:hypothetical protein